MVWLSPTILNTYYSTVHKYPNGLGTVGIRAGKRSACEPDLFTSGIYLKARMGLQRIPLAGRYTVHVLVEKKKIVNLPPGRWVFCSVISRVTRELMISRNRNNIAVKSQ